MGSALLPKSSRAGNYAALLARIPCAVRSAVLLATFVTIRDLGKHVPLNAELQNSVTLPPHPTPIA
eukprot:6078611-Prorocentrum_lima.AAC.1